MHLLDRRAVDRPACLGCYRHPGHTWDDVTTDHKREIRESLEPMHGGPRCAYCEGPIHGDGHIEHFRRKRDHPHLAFEWTNLFLSCGANEHCGHYKDRGGSPYNSDDLVKPDTDDPDDYFYFHSDGEVRVRSGIPEGLVRRATETIRVLHLDHGALVATRRKTARRYLGRHPDMILALEEFSEADRQQFIQEELEAIRAEPYSTVIRHLFETIR